MSCALLIGINYVGTQYRLHGCINDCTLIQNMLIEQYGFSSNDIVFMRDDIYGGSHPLYPNRTNIITQIQNLVNKANSSNAKQVYLHYSGHGANIRDGNSDESDGMDEFIVPIDFFNGYRRIVDDELNLLFRGLNDNSQLFCVFDCCMSGTMLDLPFNYSLEGSNFVQIQENRDNSLANKKNVICLSGCRDNEYSLDVNVNGIANGALTLGIFNILRQSNWTINLRELIIRLYKFLVDNRFNGQKPLLSSNKRIDLTTINYNYRQPQQQQTTTQPQQQQTTTQPQQQTTTQPQQQQTTTQPQQQQTTTQPQQQTSPALMVEGMLNYFISSKLITKAELNNIVKNVTGEKVVINNANVSRILDLFKIREQ